VSERCWRHVCHPCGVAWSDHDWTPTACWSCGEQRAQSCESLLTPIVPDRPNWSWTGVTWA
jgi:hypothetical protein